MKKIGGTKDPPHGPAVDISKLNLEPTCADAAKLSSYTIDQCLMQEPVVLWTRHGGWSDDEYYITAVELQEMNQGKVKNLILGSKLSSGRIHHIYRYNLDWYGKEVRLYYTKKDVPYSYPSSFNFNRNVN